MIRFLSRIRGFLITAAIIAALFLWGSVDWADDNQPGSLVNLEGLQSFTENSYHNYLINHSSSARPQVPIQLDAATFSHAEGGDHRLISDLPDTSGQALLTDETGQVTWIFQVEEAGLYHIAIRYYNVAGKSSSIEREILLNGELPFQGSESLVFERVWMNEEEAISRDNRDNDLRPSQTEYRTWQEAPLRDANGLTDEPFLYYLPAGENTLTLVSLREPMAIDYIKLYQHQEAPAYAQVKELYQQMGITEAEGIFVKVQAEDALYKSSPTLYSVPDHTSASLEPYSVSKIRINSIGGLNWRMPGQWIEWEIEAPEEGLYQIAFKAKQNLVRGIYSSRKLYLNGQVPFKEVESIPFYYDANYQMHVIGDDEPYLFHLTEGSNLLRLEVSLGDLAPLIRTVESSVLELNFIYRQILMITSAKPDPFRDYQLELRLPQMAELFKRQRDILYTVAEQLREITGEKSDKTAILYTMSAQLDEMAAHPDTVARRLEQFKINIGSLGTWLLTVRELPLQLDYLIVSSPDQELPAANRPFYTNIGHELGSFFYSFIEDYNTIGNTGEEGQESVTVWIGTGRDQAQVLKEMTDDMFTSAAGIHVDLKLVDIATLLSATLAGQGPDIAMQIGIADPVNYAMRNAAYDLSQFPDFNEVITRFRESAVVPFQFNNGVYALPEQQVFSVLFYRKDILEELGLDIPDTWDDVYRLIPELQKRHMEFGLPIQPQQEPTITPNETFAMLLFQNNGSFYVGDGERSALDDEIAMQAFQSWSDFYTSYKSPLTYDFMNRFRLGEMPIGIASYATYNMLTVAAPEIRGLWDFTVVPATVDANGNKRRDVASSGTAVMMLDAAEDKDAAWEFMKWWTDKETQIQFGREMESLMGAAARYPTANIEALQELPWPARDYQNLERQWQWVQGIPEVPGGYFTGRHLDNAFRKVVNLGENPREALYDHVLIINNEIEIKRREFGFDNEVEVSMDAASR